MPGFEPGRPTTKGSDVSCPLCNRRIALVWQETPKGRDGYWACRHCSLKGVWSTEFDEWIPPEED
jgi:hypothetical protein